MISHGVLTRATQFVHDRIVLSNVSAAVPICSRAAIQIGVTLIPDPALLSKEWPLILHRMGSSDSRTGVEVLGPTSTPPTAYLSHDHAVAQPSRAARDTSAAPWTRRA
jgi:hypothetical protein